MGLATGAVYLQQHLPYVVATFEDAMSLSNVRPRQDAIDDRMNSAGRNGGPHMLEDLRHDGTLFLWRACSQRRTVDGGTLGQ